MKTKSGTSSRISSRNVVKRLAVLDRLDDDRVRQAFPAEARRLVDRADEVDQHAHVAQRVADQHAHSRGARRPPARGCPRAPWSCSDCGQPSSISVAERPAISSFAVFGNSRTSVVMPPTSLRSTIRPIVQAVCSISRQVSESRRGGDLGRRRSVVDLVGGAVREAAGQPRMHRPGLEVDGEVDVRVGVGERPVERRVEQAEQERAVDDDARRLQLRLQGDAARLGLAGAQREHALQHLLELQHLVRLAHAAGSEARQLLADHAGLARLLDLVAQRAQARAVDLAGGGEDVDALERGGQRPGDLGADLRRRARASAASAAARHGGRTASISHGNLGRWAEDASESSRHAVPGRASVQAGRLRVGLVGERATRWPGCLLIGAAFAGSVGLRPLRRQTRTDWRRRRSRKVAKCDNLFTDFG